MTEPTKPVDAKDSAPEALTLGVVRKLVADTVSAALKGVERTEGTAHAAAQQHTESRLDRSSTIQATVQAELDKLKAKEDSEKKEADLQAKLAELTEATAEKAPIERRRVHKLMGWGEPT